MAEDLTITFQGVDEVSSKITEIYNKLNELPDEDAVDKEDTDFEITIASDQIEPEIEEVMWDVLDKIKTRATEDEAEFLLNIE